VVGTGAGLDGAGLEGAGLDGAAADPDGDDGAAGLDGAELPHPASTPGTRTATASNRPVALAMTFNVASRASAAAAGMGPSAEPG
jgi:hypothetical protein